jgi:hypothetical protein
MEGSIASLFHHHDITWGIYMQNALKFPKISICHDSQLMPFHYHCKNGTSDKRFSEYRKINKYHFDIFYDPQLEPLIQSCLNL